MSACFTSPDPNLKRWQRKEICASSILGVATVLIFTMVVLIVRHASSVPAEELGLWSCVGIIFFMLGCILLTVVLNVLTHACGIVAGIEEFRSKTMQEMEAAEEEEETTSLSE